MPNWKKVAISGSNISQFNNDGVYTKMSGSTANGLLTYVNSETASVEPNIIYDGASQYLKNNGKHITYSGSIFTSPPASAGTLAAFNSGRGDSRAWNPVSGSGNYAVIALSRYASFGNGNECSATLGIIAQKGTSDNNAVVELTSIAKQDSCNDAIFSVGVRSDAGAGVEEHPVKEFIRIDGRDETIFLSGSVSIQTQNVATSASLSSVLVYDNNTGEIKKSTLTPSTGTTSPGGANTQVQFNDNDSFGGDSGLTYSATTDKLTIKNPGTGAGGLVTNNIESGNSGITLTISDGGLDSDVSICSYGGENMLFTDGENCIYGQVFSPNLTTTTATTCPSVVISTSGELLAGPVGGAGASTLQEVTTEGNTTNNPIIFNGTSTTSNCIKVANVSQTGPVDLLIEGSDNSSGTGGVGGDIDICAGNATSTTGGNGGSIFLNAGFATNQGAAKGCVQVNCSVGLKVANGSLAVGNITNSSTTGRIDASNDIVAYSTSDCRLKKYIKPISNALDKIDQIRGVEFDWKVTDEKMEEEVHSFEGHDVGVIAQEIEAVLPEVVVTRDNGYKAVNYEKIVPLLIQGIKELKSEVEILKSKI
jgi:hypothetical protein|tara:strand:+ start:213 stop:1988 length:1776 start_codon:yes stop_codon:yes gene_type:complete